MTRPQSFALRETRCPGGAPLKSRSQLRGRSDFSIDRLDSAPRQELSLREIADFSVRSLRQPAVAVQFDVEAAELVPI